MARILLVDTNFSAGPIRDWLRASGHDVWIAGGKPDDFLAGADPQWHRVDYADPRALVRAVEDLGIQFVIPGCNDRSYSSCSLASEHRAFHGIDPPTTTETINNKRAFRQFAAQQRLSVPETYTLEKVPAHLPVIIKPVDAFSGRGITVVTSSENCMLSAIEAARSASPTREVVIEEFVEGQLFSHSCFIKNGSVSVDFVVIEHCSANPYAVDTSYVVDDFPANVLDEIRAQIEHLAQTLQLTDGLLHTQFIFNNEKFWLIELTRRCPGDLYSQLIELSTGYPYAASYAAAFIGKPLDLPRPTVSLLRPILRHTVTTREKRTLQDLRFHVPLHLERIVPLATTGAALEQAPAGRVALLFLKARDPKSLRELSDIATRRELYSLG